MGGFASSLHRRRNAIILMLDGTSPPDLKHDANPLVSPELSAGIPSDKDLQRAEGSCRIVLSGSERGTRVMDVFQRSPRRAPFPRADGAAIEEALFAKTR